MPNLMTPYEIISTPFDVYVTTGTDAFPLVSALVVPAGALTSGGWMLLGSSGVGGQNQKEGGVTVSHEQTFQTIRTEGHTGPFKVTRLTEDQKVAFTLFDLTMNAYTHVMQGDAVVVQGSTGYDVGLSRGPDVVQVKILVRGSSPLAANKNAQYQIPRAYQSASSSVQFSKTAPAGLNYEYTCLEDPSSLTTAQRFGKLVVER